MLTLVVALPFHTFILAHCSARKVQEFFVDAKPGKPRRDSQGRHSISMKRRLSLEVFGYAEAIRKLITLFDPSNIFYFKEVEIEESRPSAEESSEESRPSPTI